MKNLKVLILLLLIISIFTLSVHDSFHTDSFYTYFSPYRLNIKDQNPCYICDLEGLIGRLVEKIVFSFFSLFLIFVLVLFARRETFVFVKKNTFWSPISLKVRMNN